MNKKYLLHFTFNFSNVLPEAKNMLQFGTTNLLANWAVDNDLFSDLSKCQNVS